jgi:hypothetical protein
MARRLLTLMLILPVQLGCGSTWARPSAGEMPLHRSLWGLEPDEPPCTLPKSEWMKRCGPENYGNEKICPEGCPIAMPDEEE